MSEKNKKETATDNVRSETKSAWTKKARNVEEPQPIEILAQGANMPAWELAGVRRALGWAEGKQVTQTVFDQALAAFRKRPQGGGRITLCA